MDPNPRNISSLRPPWHAKALAAVADLARHSPELVEGATPAVPLVTLSSIEGERARDLSSSPLSFEL